MYESFGMMVGGFWMCVIESFPIFPLQCPVAFVSFMHEHFGS